MSQSTTVESGTRETPEVASQSQGTSTGEATPATASEILDESKDQKMKGELKRLDRKYDDDGDKIYIERKNTEDKKKQLDWWNLYALCETRHFDNDGDYSYTRLHVNSQSLKQLLQDVIGDFPNELIDAEQSMELDLPTYCLFFYRQELETEGRKCFKEDQESLGHLELLLAWIDETLADEFRSHNRAVNSDSKAISYDHMWTLFKPQSLVYTHVLGQPRIFKLTKFRYVNSDEPHFTLEVEFVDYDGDKFGMRDTHLAIPKFTGTMRCLSFNVMPLELHPSKEQIQKYLLERGRRFENMTGQHFMQYDGVAVKRQKCTYERFNLSGRVMIDCKTYHRLDPNDTFGVTEIARSEAAKRQRQLRKQGAVGIKLFSSEEGEDADGEIIDVLLDEDCILTNATVRGFAFTHKRFMEFFVDKLSEIQWNTDCFDQLVLDPAPKRTVQALVSMHARRRDDGLENFDDIIKGKGQGLVMVLHGPPGVGKTLTAECVAECVRRPLYMVSSGDLGTNSTTLDKELTRIMDMTSTWGAVLLIDEADVFLERRSLHDMHRNAMVSVFLRVLEYYSGILFLTTNRVATFDDAFKSRIHVPLRYRSLTEDSRRTIWRDFCSRVPGGVSIDEDGLARLAKHELNGRQIKNVIKAAESLAAFEGKKLDVAQLEQVMMIQVEFEKDLSEAAGAGSEAI